MYLRDASSNQWISDFSYQGYGITGMETTKLHESPYARQMLADEKVTPYIPVFDGLDVSLLMST